MLFGVSSDIPNIIIHAKFHVDRLKGFWAAGPPKVPFPILIGTTFTTVLHYRADCNSKPKNYNAALISTNYLYFTKTRIRITEACPVCNRVTSRQHYSTVRTLAVSEEMREQ